MTNPASTSTSISALSSQPQQLVGRLVAAGQSVAAQGTHTEKQSCD
jgi:hypothetical protein